MKTIEINKINDNVKKWKRVENKEPNINESCLISSWWQVVWFYVKWDDVPKRLRDIATLMNNELLSERVPKTLMSRIYYDKQWNEIRLDQFSAIIWAVQPSPFKKRYVPWLSHLHLVESAKKYIKLKYIFAKECEKLIKKITPELYEKQKELLKSQKIKIWNLFTSWIDNFNWAVNTHIDWWNIKWANNIIYFKRKNSEGWNLHIPEYWWVVDCEDNSLVYYPAYAHIHWVDNIIPTKIWWYRNSLVLYPLNIKYV